MVVDADAPEIAVGVDGEALLPATPVVCGIPPGPLHVRGPRGRPGVPRANPPTDWPTLRRPALARRAGAAAG
ncbi:hypothetical protein [Streptomyces sp. NPDC001492]